MKKAFLITFLILVSFFILPSRDYALENGGEQIKMYMGEVKIVPVSSPTRIAIANPDIVDVTQVTKSEITLSPKASGATTLILWDNFGEQSFKVRVSSEDLTDIKRRVDNLLKTLGVPGVYTKIEEDEDKLMLLGRIKTAQVRERISTILGPLMGKVVDLMELKEEDAVIEIDVQVLELDKGATDTLGFTWPGSINFLEVGAPGLTSTGTTWGKVFKMGNIERGTAAGGADPYTLKFDALIQEGKARILSRPRLACQSGKEAKLIVGGEIPIFTATQTSTGTTGDVAYKDYGIILNIRPTVDEEQRIHLNLGVEVSEIGSTAESTSYARAYPLTKRNASTEVYMDNGETMAIGGLIKQKSEEDLRRFPWLSDVPVLGAFFRQKVTKSGGGFGSKSDTELFITLTPRIIERKSPLKEVKKEVKPQIETLPVVSGTLPANIAGYATIIQKRILDDMVYPASAKEAGFQGTTKISLLLSFRGELLDAKIKTPSGFNILDDNAINVAKGIASYPPFPSSIDQKELWIDVPIVYRLD
jgi:pilus assembly protein CpaC